MPVLLETCATVSAKDVEGAIGVDAVRVAVVVVVVELIPSSAASSSSSAMVVPATNRGSRDSWRPGVPVLVETTSPLLFLGGEVKRLFPEAVESFARLEDDNNWLESGEEEDLGQEKRFDVEEADSTLPENILELAKVEVEEKK